MSTDSGTVQTKDALLAQYHDVIAKQREVIAKYAKLDIEMYLEEAAERKAIEDEEQLRLQMNKQSTLSKFREIHKLRYADVPLWKLLHHFNNALWQSWHSNPYNLHAFWYLLMLFLLLTWLIGSTTTGYYEARVEGEGSVMLAKMWKGILGSIPPMVQFILFLFPPLFVNF